MVLTVLDINIRPGRREVPFVPMVKTSFKGGGVQVASTLSRELRRHSIEHLAESGTALASVVEFFRVVGFGSGSFLWKHPDGARYPRAAFERVSATGLVTLTQNGGNIYDLPATGQYGGDYPIDGVDVQLFDAGVAVDHASVDTDARTITYSAPPAGATTANYHFYRRFLMEGLAIGDPISGAFPVEFELVEFFPNA